MDNTIFDSLIKKIAKKYSKKCPNCNTPCIQAILNSYNDKIECLRCKKQILFLKIIFKIFTFFMRIDNEELKELSSNKETISLVKALVRGVAKYGIKAVKIGLPIYVVFDITDKCNLKCIHCYSTNQDKELSTNDVFRILDMLYESGVGMIDFGGGEPLMRADIFDIISYSKKLGLYTSISTNGLLLDSANIKRLKDIKIDHVCISLDGVNSKMHDQIRNKKGAYNKTIDGIKNCVKLGIETQISSVFMKRNIDDLKEMFNLLESLKVDGWFIYDFVPAGRGKELQKEVLDSNQRKDLFNFLQNIAITSKISLKPYPYSITINSACGKDSYFYKKYGRLTEIFKGCLTGRWTCHVSSNGDMHPCYLLPHILGNLKFEEFESIWFNKKNSVLNELRNRSLLKGSCGVCKFREVCGGCRAQAFWRTNSYLESDNCWIKS